jgi:HSP20 family protein
MDFWHGRRDVRELRARVDQAFRLARQQAAAGPPAYPAPMDFGASPEGFTIALDLPGVDRESLDVRAEHGALIVTGRKLADEADGTTVLRRERTYGTFTRTIPLPDEADLTQVTAKLKNGELQIKVGRRAEAEGRRIEVVVE